ncbi:MAG: hypothetical protein EOP10_18120 [Proteobacteria bacterium]|nr:MAG: hypothetical protein EOP10_18120 [Pseudomonadota bacterium]
MNVKHLLFVCPILLSFACNEKKKFDAGIAAAKIQDAPKVEQADDSIKKLPVKKDEPVTDPETEVGDTVPVTPEIPKCDVGESEVLNAALLSTGIDLSLKNQIIKYELSLQSCKDGSIIPINDQTILFDLDLVFKNTDQKISYSVVESSSSKSIVSGDLTMVPNKDLFGKTGSNYQHWKTLNVSFTTKVEKVILEFNLKNAQLSAYNPLDTTVETYLRVGDAAPVRTRINLIK